MKRCLELLSFSLSNLRPPSTMPRLPPASAFSACFLLLVLLGAGVAARGAEQVYLTEEGFLAEAFAGQVPEPGSIWLVRERREAVTRILGHEPEYLRLRYWRRGTRSAWILEEIGKSRPITAGFVVEDGRIEKVAVLVYRESRGGEVRHDFFTRQFEGAGLRENGGLDREIDSIVGATLSVNGIERLARLSLYLHLETGEAAGG
jgi:hypothetical protein